MKAGCHPAYIKSRVGCKLLNRVQHLLWPVQVKVIGDNDEAITAVTDQFKAALDKQIDAFSAVAGTPRWVRIEAVKRRYRGHGVEAVVKLSIEVVDVLRASESLDGVYDSLVEIEDGDHAGALFQDSARYQVRHANTDRIAIPHKGEPLAGGPPCHELALHDHVTCLHVDLIKLAKWQRSILNDIRYRVDGGSQVDFAGHAPKHPQTSRLLLRHPQLGDSPPKMLQGRQPCANRQPRTTIAKPSADRIGRGSTEAAHHSLVQFDRESQHREPRDRRRA